MIPADHPFRVQALPELSDEEMNALCTRGQHDAVTRTEFLRRCMSTAIKAASCAFPEHADDALSAAMEAAIQASDRWTPGAGRAVGYVYERAKWRVLDACKRRRLHVSLDTLNDDDPGAEQWLASSGDAYADIERADLERRLHNAIIDLSPREQRYVLAIKEMRTTPVHSVAYIRIIEKLRVALR